jgi:hypothetical protein
MRLLSFNSHSPKRIFRETGCRSEIQIAFNSGAYPHSNFIYPQPDLENALRTIGSSLEFPDDSVMTMIETRKTGRQERGQPMYPARMALLVAGHTAFVATFVWLFH